MVVFDFLRSLIKRLLFRLTDIKVRMAEEEVEPERKQQQQQQQQHDGFKFLKSEDEAKFSNSRDDTSLSNAQYNESTPHGLPDRWQDQKDIIEMQLLCLPTNVYRTKRMSTRHLVSVSESYLHLGFWCCIFWYRVCKTQPIQYSQILRRQCCLSRCAPVRVDFQDIKVFVKIDRRHLPDLVAGTQHGDSQVYLT